ncbi:MAG: 50S ribosomal protein L11 methyltransferase [Armatimonadetes bacterium]|nr:50S ribosomal protein L11 methyltransferase [Armatimonadota bacterium]
MRWAEICVTAPKDASEAVAQALFDAGCTGVSSVGTSQDRSLGWLAVNDTLEARLLALRERLDGLQEHGFPGAAHISVRHVDDVRWLDEWRKYHRAMTVGKRLLICPSWEVPMLTTDRAVVLLDPGMAFGTGSHPTTKLCLEALNETVTPGMVVADVGTGSGILAIAAVKLGAAHAYASEIDLLPRRIAAENVERNGIAASVTVMTPDELADLQPVCDLVVCNIIAETIAELADLLASLVRPNGGVLIASGIVEERLSLATEALARSGMLVREVRSDDVWRAVIAAHDSRT